LIRAHGNILLFFLPVMEIVRAKNNKNKINRDLQSLFHSNTTKSHSLGSYRYKYMKTARRKYLTTWWTPVSVQA